MIEGAIIFVIGMVTGIAIMVCAVVGVLAGVGPRK